MLKLCNWLKPVVWYFWSLEKLAIKMWLPFNSAKKLKGAHFLVGGSKNLKLWPNTCFDVSFQKKLLFSFLLFWPVCYEDGLSDSKRNEIASLMARNFNNSRLPNGTFSETINFCWNIWLIENVSYFYFWNKTRQKDQNFHFFKEPFLRNGWPYGCDFWRIFRHLRKASEKNNFSFFQDTAKVITI